MFSPDGTYFLRPQLATAGCPHGATTGQFRIGRNDVVRLGYLGPPGMMLDQLSLQGMILGQKGLLVMMSGQLGIS